ncbi:MAG: hypothetical protein ACLQK8_27415 [Streptosporangiaceae bacterium]
MTGIGLPTPGMPPGAAPVRLAQWAVSISQVPGVPMKKLLMVPLALVAIGFTMAAGWLAYAGLPDLKRYWKMHHM